MSRTTAGSHRNARPLQTQQCPSPEARGERRLVSPFRCRIWTQHSRPEEQLTELACKSLRESIARNGQHQPALGRPVTDDRNYDIEIICGARRHAAALSLGRPLLVEVRTLSDAEAYVAMYDENVERKDDCPYVQGQILRRALLSGTSSSQEELSHTFTLSHSKVSRLLMVAQLPSAIVAAFDSPQDIRESWGVQLYQLWKDKDPDHTMASRARALRSTQPRPRARDIYESLLTAPTGLRRKHRLNRSVPVCGPRGLILFREQEQIESVTFTISKAILSETRRDQLRQEMVRVLEPAGSGPAPQRTSP